MYILIDFQSFKMPKSIITGITNEKKQISLNRLQVFSKTALKYI